MNIPDLRQLRVTWKQYRAPLRLTDTQRAERLAAQAAISEHNRRVRLAQRPDADARIAAAEAKRARKARERVWNAASTHAGNPRWYTA